MRRGAGGGRCLRRGLAGLFALTLGSAHAQTALDEIVIDGIRTNIPLHQQLVRDEAFHRGGVSIHYLEKKLKL